MNISKFIIAIAAAATAAFGGAQPAKDASPRKAPPTAATAPVVLASASDVRHPATTQDERATQPVRRPAPRATTCRCGDPQLSQNQSDDNQPEQ